ncbi:hypothetical protein Pint_23292 [Pistacia integerrima]|uniref:Uncharacterized protein n=1 Tax=Pistacia integerrima TaxID=434235 RepID=A0ACC0YKQ4_9ROSI|nr:hypothetical protein Pint_23292 [Pistacia integerrima]
MGKKLDALFGRNFKSYKFKPQVNLAISRLAVLKNQRQVKCNQARSDVVQLLQQGHQERALLRVEHVIKERNMLDAFIMMESYCNLLIERVHLIEQDKECPIELREPISTLLFAASRCGEFPELQEIRALFTSRYGKEFVNRAIELRNNCAVNARMIQKLSTRQPELENRMKVLKEIATENGIVLQLEEASSISSEEILDVSKKQNQTEPKTSTNLSPTRPGDHSQNSPNNLREDDEFSDSMKAGKKYKDVADAAQAAFESAAHAAAAARAAVELSRSEFHDPDDHSGPSTWQRRETGRDDSVKLESESKIEEILGESKAAESKHSENEAEHERSISSSSSDLTEEKLKVTTMSTEVDPETLKLLEKDIDFDNSDSEGSVISHKQIRSSSQASLKVESGQSTAHAAEESVLQSKQHLDMATRPMSVRTRFTRQVRGY